MKMKVAVPKKRETLTSETAARQRGNSVGETAESPFTEYDKSGIGVTGGAMDLHRGAFCYRRGNGYTPRGFLLPAGQQIYIEGYLGIITQRGSGRSSTGRRLPGYHNTPRFRAIEHRAKVTWVS